MKFKLLFLTFIFVVISFFYKDFVFFNKLPIPSDTIVGLYYPFRDLYSKNYPRGIPFKNFMITDPVRQQIPWKNLSIDILKKGELPLWNPYNFSGQPLLSNFQSGVFYPLNFIFFVLPFVYSWSIFVIFQSILALVFSYLYLNNLKLDKRASVFGSITFSFGGFIISWLEWGNVVHTALWLPLILLSIDKIFEHSKEISNIKNLPAGRHGKKFFLWFLILLFSTISSFFAGHLQIFFYISVLSFTYFIFRWLENKKIYKILFVFFIFSILFLILTFVQWFPTLQFILNSGRILDQDWRTIEGWFVPYQNLVQVLVPDFFGNPSTLNYFGVFNYGEFVSYAGVGAVIFSLVAIFRKDKNTAFFIAALFIALLFALPTAFAKIPFKLDIPFISSAQPTRLIFIADYCIAVLAALGFDYYLKSNKKRKILIPLTVLSAIFVSFWLYILYFAGNIPYENRLVSRNNLILPSLLFLTNAFFILILVFFPHRNTLFKKAILMLPMVLIFILFLDLTRFGWKYLPFTEQKYFYPKTPVIDFLVKNTGNFRIMATDSRILPPNFSAVYKIQSVDGYDPLYGERYAELVAAISRGEPNINPPFGFNRIITPQNINSRLIDVLGVKYILTFEEIKLEKVFPVFSDKSILIYENKTPVPKAFFVSNVHLAEDKQDAINKLFKFGDDLRTNAVVEGGHGLKTKWEWFDSKAKITKYSENRVEIETISKDDGYLVLTDSFYPTWKAEVDGRKTKIYLTDYNFRGIIVPEGNHKVVFYNTLF